MTQPFSYRSSLCSYICLSQHIVAYLSARLRHVLLVTYIHLSTLCAMRYSELSHGSFGDIMGIDLRDDLAYTDVDVASDLFGIRAIATTSASQIPFRVARRLSPRVVRLSLLLAQRCWARSETEAYGPLISMAWAELSLRHRFYYISMMFNRIGIPIFGRVPP
jgi:hypothetical protein